MNVVFKKYNFVVLVLTILLAPSQGYSQDLFDDSFLSDPQNKSITVKSDGNGLAPSMPSVAPAPIPATERAPVIVPVPAAASSNMNVPAPVPMDVNMEAPVQEVVIEEVIAVEPEKKDVKTLVAEPKAAVSITSDDTKSAISRAIDEPKTPSEKVIGSISREMFQEMADLEKENSLLNLQLKQEKLKNEINEVKAMQRQSLMNEIEKRELAARSRVEWEHEQELREIEVWEKRQKADLLAKQIKGMISGKDASANVGGISGVNNSASGNAAGNASKIYYIVEIRGLGDDLVAKIADDEEKKVFFVKKGSVLPTGHKVLQIYKDHVKLTLNGRDEALGFSITSAE